MHGQGRLTPLTLAILNECGLKEVLDKLPSETQPPSLLVTEAFAITPLEQTRYVLLGQDPYLDGATGLSFSKKRGVPLSESAKIMFGCLTRCGFRVEPAATSGAKTAATSGAKSHCDLTCWARQGVLCINAALTVGKVANDHKQFWKDFMSKLITRLARGIAGNAPPEFILLGGPAQSMRPKVPGCVVHCWGHPSPVNTANRDVENPKAFIHCDIFSKIPIDWGLFPATSFIARGPHLPDDYPEELSDSYTLWLFTDGAATANGKANCRASWAYHVTDGITHHEDSGECAPVEIPGKVYKTSNQRGELMAILKGIWFCLYEAQNDNLPFAKKLVVVTDSQYSIGMLDEGYRAACNEDLISYTLDLLGQLKAHLPVEFVHQRSHLKKSDVPSPNTLARFKYDHNDRVDFLANQVLRG